ncbi:MAG: hypothetical protein ACRCS9_13530 [Hyphomicrobium sp.]
MVNSEKQGETDRATTPYATGRPAADAIPPLARIGRVRRWQALRDAVMAFSLLLVATVALGANPSSALPGVVGGVASVQARAATPGLAQPALADADDRTIVEIATVSSASSPDAVYRRTSGVAALGLLMAAISALAALNLALFRHLREAYADPRKRKTR